MHIRLSLLTVDSNLMILGRRLQANTIIYTQPKHRYDSAILYPINIKNVRMTTAKQRIDFAIKRIRK